MKAIFLVGGKGTRLRPLTAKIPKPMVPLMNKPLLVRNLERVVQYGVDEVILCAGYKSSMIESYFMKNKIDGLQIRFAFEDSPLGTGGAIKNAAQDLTEEFFVFNADILNRIDLRQMARFHKRMKADVTIAVTSVEDPSSYGVIEQKNGYALRFKEKPRLSEITSHFINAGVYLFKPEVLPFIEDGRPVSLEREVFPRLLAEGKKIAVYENNSYWLDIGNPRAYLQAHKDILDGKYLLPKENYVKNSLYQEGNSTVPLSSIREPVYLGQNVHISLKAIVGPYACIGDDCIIDAGCVVQYSLLWNKVHIKKDEKISGAIITPDCRLFDLQDVFVRDFDVQEPDKSVTLLTQVL